MTQLKISLKKTSHLKNKRVLKLKETDEMISKMKKEKKIEKSWKGEGDFNFVFFLICIWYFFFFYKDMVTRVRCFQAARSDAIVDSDGSHSLFHHLGPYITGLHIHSNLNLYRFWLVHFVSITKYVLSFLVGEKECALTSQNGEPYWCELSFFMVILRRLHKNFVNRRNVFLAMLYGL